MISTFTRLSTRTALFALLSINAAVVILALLFAPARDPLWHFEELHAVTWFSFAQLLLIAAVARQIYRLERGQAKGHVWQAPEFIWLLIAIGFAYLAVDEIAMLHENIDYALHSIAGFKESAYSDRLDDAIIGAYGVVGLVVLWKRRHYLMAFSASLPYFASGYFLLFVMVVLDAVTNRRDVVQALFADVHTETLALLVLKAAEDGTKVFAEATFLIGFHKCIRIVMALHEMRQGERDAG